MDLLGAYGSDSESQGDDNRDAVVHSPAEIPPSKRTKLDEGYHQLTVSTPALPSAEALLADILTAGSSAAAQQRPAATGGIGPAAACAAATTRQLPSGKSAVIKLGNSRQLPPEPARIRTFPHVEGNFATVVYITVDESAQAQLHSLATRLLSECPSATAAAAATGVTSTQPAPAAAASSTATHASSSSNPTAAPAASKHTPDTSTLHLWPTFPWTPAAAVAAATPAPSQAVQENPAPQDAPSQEATDQQQLPLHMSISRTVPIKRIQIDSLQAALTKQLKPFKACRVQLQGLVCLVNDAATRSFVGVKVAAGEARVVRLVEAVNRAFITHGLQPFYEVPLPHVSLAWTPGDQASRLQPWLDSMEHEAVQLKVSQVVCQIGKMRHVVWQG